MFMFTLIFFIYVYVHLLHVFYGLVWLKKYKLIKLKLIQTKLVWFHISPASPVLARFVPLSSSLFYSAQASK